MIASITSIPISSVAAYISGVPQRHINGVVSNGVVPKSQICKLVAQPAPDIFRIQGVYLLVLDLEFIILVLEG